LGELLSFPVPQLNSWSHRSALRGGGVNSVWDWGGSGNGWGGGGNWGSPQQLTASLSNAGFRHQVNRVGHSTQVIFWTTGSRIDPDGVFTAFPIKHVMWFEGDGFGMGGNWGNMGSGFSGGGGSLIHDRTFNRVGFVPLDRRSGSQMANYKMNVRIYQHGNSLSIRASAFNTPVSGGNAIPSARATLMVDGRAVQTNILSLTQGASISSAEGLRLFGETSFIVPEDGRVDIRFHGGWNVHFGHGAFVPVYHPFFPFAININRRFRIP
ncbi:MAG: hypothetical protein FWC94_06815, partial [Bacteroidales bacterium]|nr:hypothetical protein [Bacteroidales bacterium]